MSIVAKNLNKVYKNRVRVLENVNLNIESGMFGLLGQNGAGKSTLMKILTTLIKPTSGSIEICGRKLNKKNEMYIKSITGYMPQEFGFYSSFKVDECLEYMSILKGISKREQKREIDAVVEKVNLQEHRNKKYKELSGGMKRHVGLAQALLGEPKILIVDEPTAGVDPKERIGIRNILSNYSKDHIVLLSTHIIEDIAMTCNKLAVLHLGHILYNGEVKNLIKQAKGKVYSCVLENVTKSAEVSERYVVVSSQYVGSKMELKVISEEKPEGMVCEQVEPSLEDAYMYITSLACKAARG